MTEQRPIVILHGWNSTSAWSRASNGGLSKGSNRASERQRALLHRLAERRFGPAAAERLSTVLASVTDADRLAEAGEWIVDCAKTADFLTRVSR